MPNYSKIIKLVKHPLKSHVIHVQLSLTYTVKIHGRRILDPRGRVTFVRSVAVVCVELKRSERTLVSLEAKLKVNGDH